MSCFDTEYERDEALRCSRRHQRAASSAQFLILFINANFVADNASHALASSATLIPTFNAEEEVFFIRNGWTPKEEACMYVYIFISLCLVYVCNISYLNVV